MQSRRDSKSNYTSLRQSRQAGYERQRRAAVLVTGSKSREMFGAQSDRTTGRSGQGGSSVHDGRDHGRAAGCADSATRNSHAQALLQGNPETRRPAARSVASDSCDPMDCSPPGSSVHGILQARIPERVATPFSRGSSRPRNWTWVSCLAVRFVTIRSTRKL